MDPRDATSISRRTALGAIGTMGTMGAALAVPAALPAQAAPRRNLEGKVALVTGSGSNLGASTVLELARRGADVIVNARSSREEAESVAGEARGFGVRAIALLADVGVEQQVNDMVAEGIRQLGRIDILVNNAGYRASRPITEMTTEQWRAAAAVNFDGPFFCTRAVVPGMIANRWGRIITVSGLNSWNGQNNWAHVCASKMGAVGMTRALAVELARHNILVNHVVPGAYDAHPDMTRIPLARLGLDAELANLYAFLASDEASYITGQSWHVNGGEQRT